MRKLAFGGTMLAALAVGVPAFAADLPVKAPAIAPEVFSWTGLYVGANLGYSWGRANTDFTETTFGTISRQIFDSDFNVPIGPPTVVTLPTTTGFGSSRAHLDGVIAGDQIGYNWQYGSWLFGLEGDIQGTSQRGDTVICLTAGCPLGGIFGTASYKLPWLATARGRVGVAVAPKWLLYATGGLAVGEVEKTFVDGLGGGPIATASSNTTRAGYVAGGGVEGALDNHWSAKLEALWVDLGRYDTALAGVSTSTATNAGNTPILRTNTVTTTTFTTTGSFHTHVTDLIVRVGVNYRFGGPLVANY